MNELEIIRDEFGRYEHFKAYRNGNFSGDLLVYPENDLWIIEDIRVSPKRRGIGSALLREFSAFIGGNRLIKACLNHRPSVEAIRINGLVPIELTDEFIINDPKKLSLLPMTKIFSCGNIDSTELRFVRSNLAKRNQYIASHFVAYLYGITRQLN